MEACMVKYETSDSNYGSPRSAHRHHLGRFFKETHGPEGTGRIAWSMVNGQTRRADWWCAVNERVVPAVEGRDH